MNVTQLYTIINSLATQSLGMSDLKPTKADFVAVGETVLSTQNNKDTFLNALYDYTGKTVIAIRAYESKRRDTLYRDPFEYGAIMRKISYTMPKAQENPAWRDVTQPSASLQEKTPLSIRQYFFRGVSTWEVPGTIPDDQLKSAFANPEDMAAFISGIFINMDNAMKIAYENAGNTALGSFAAAIVNSGNTVCAINLLAEYNAQFTKTLAAKDSMYDAGFLRYAAQRIKNVSENMENMSTTFNIIGQERFTRKDLQVLEVLALFASSFDTYLQSDVFHNELTKMPYYTTVPFWQGSGKTWNFADISSINLTVDDTSGTPQELKASGVVAVLRDRDAVGTTINNPRTRSFYDAHNEVTNYWEKANVAYFRDMSENGVVFYVEDPTPTPPQPSNPT